MAIDFQAFEDFMAELSVFCKQELTPKMKGIYYKSLSKYIGTEDLDLILQAIAEDNSIGRYRFPSVQELIEPIGKGLNVEIQRSWRDVQELAQGRLKLSQLSPVIQQAVASIGGVSAIKGSSDKEFHFLRKPFEQAYKSYKSCQDYDEHQAKLIAKETPQVLRPADMPRP